jgi:7,8-didemethyl-8-hydroxy-5-deazariboflavin synthase
MADSHEAANCFSRASQDMGSPKSIKKITYSPSLTLPLTRACVNRCLYCGYRKEGDGLLSLESMMSMAGKARQDGISEILLLSGEKSDQTPRVRQDLDRWGVDSLVSFAVSLCERLLEENLLPHVNIGPLDSASLERLRNVSASMGLMIEGVNPEVNSRVHPGKSLRERWDTLEFAGRLKIPFTTGILMGVGESQKDRLASILDLKTLQEKYGHLQEIILQRYVPNRQSLLPSLDMSRNEMEPLIRFCKTHLPGVSIQIPPNLDPSWEKCLVWGADDLGGMGGGGDLVNPEHPWPDLTAIAQKVRGAGFTLNKRLPIYRPFYQAGWYSERVGRALRYWIEGRDEYRYYS